MARFYTQKKTKSSKQAPKNQKHITLTIQHLSHLGEGMAKINGKWVFVEGALAGETITAKPSNPVAGRQIAQLIDVKEASKHRVQPHCAHYQSCGGCQLQHLQHAEQLEFKQQSLLRLLSKQQVSTETTKMLPAITGPQLAYRRAAKLACHFDPKHQQLSLGFRKRNSKAIVNIGNCPALHPALNKLLPELYMLATGLIAVKHLGHIELLFVDTDTLPAINFRFTTELTDIDIERLKQFGIRHSCHVFVQLKQQNICKITPAPSTHIHAGCTLTFSPTDFFQANGVVNDKLINRVLDWLDDHQGTLIEWYAGKGNFTLPIAKHVQAQTAAIHAVELSPSMTETLKNTIATHKLNGVTVETADLNEIDYWQHWQQLAPTCALLDPPREGAKLLCENIVRLPSVQKIIYVSCNPNSFARDASLLQQAGFLLEKLAIADMYPQSFHSESIALFTKVD